MINQKFLSISVQSIVLALLPLILGVACAFSIRQPSLSSTPDPAERNGTPQRLPPTWTPTKPPPTFTLVPSSTLAPTSTRFVVPSLTPDAPQNTSPDLDVTTVPSQPIPDDWLTYRDQEFEIRYPALLDVTIKGSAIQLSHVLPYTHENPCFGWGGPYCEKSGGCSCNDQGCVGDVLLDFTDFDVNIQIVEKSAEEIVADLQPAYPVSGILAGDLEGNVFSDQIESCGSYHYLFPLNDTRTLFVSRVNITEYDTWQEADMLALPGVIVPEVEDELFHTILSSLRIIN